MASRAMKKRHGTRNRRRSLPFIMFLTALVTLMIAGGVGGYALVQSWLTDLPDYQDASAYNLAQKTRVYASDNSTLLAEFYVENREPLSDLNDISAYVREGTVATEDVRFYEHNGVDLWGIGRAIVNNVTGGNKEGASTLTQQFVRNTVLSSEASEQTLKRKIREAYISLKLEEAYSKDEILLMYLNTVNYGSGAYGIEAAAKRYYSVDANNLTLAQAALLVGIPQSPTYNNPINYPDQALSRRNTVLNRMVTNGYITQEAYDEAIAEPLGLNPSEPGENGIVAYPYFTSYVRQQLLENYSEAEVFKGGLTVTTTLDPVAQEAAETAATHERKQLESDVDVAMVAVDPQTGFIRALIGGRDFNTSQYNLATQAQRQPGSSFKTFTLAAMIEEGINPTATYVNCSSHTKIGDWSVENYDGADYGTRSVASAFAVSSNTGFARICSAIGADRVVDMAKRMGIESELEAVPSITLGSEGVTVREMAAAYATIATGGIHRDAVAIEKITDSNGNVIFQADTTGHREISQQVAHATEKVMEGVVTSGTGRAASLKSGQVVAGKTGTSQNYRDKWFVGITPQYSVACWEGAPEERPLSPSGSVTDMFAVFMNELIARGQTKTFTMDKAGDPTYRSLTPDERSMFGAGGYDPNSASEEERKKEQNLVNTRESGETENEAQTPQANNAGGETVTPTSPTTPTTPTTPTGPTNNSANNAVTPTTPSQGGNQSSSNATPSSP